jgi:hypothetical protein
MTGTELATTKDRPANTIDPMPAKPLSGEVLRPMQRMGVPGFVVTGGYVLPAEIDRRLPTKERQRLYEANLTDVNIVATGVRYFLDLVAGAEWNFEAADESEEAQAWADFVKDALNDMETPLSRVVRRAAMYKFYGYSIQEWTLKSREDGRIGFADIEPRPQNTIERWDIDGTSGRVRGVWQRNPNNGIELYIPRDKIVYVTDDTLSDSPEGLGLFRHLIRACAGIARFEDLEHWGFETDLRGVPVGRAPIAQMDKMVEDNEMSKATAMASRAVIDNFIMNHIRGPNTGIVLDSSTYATQDDKVAPSSNLLWDVSLLKAEGSSHGEINEAIKRKTLEAARLLGVEHLLLGSEGGGSLALATNSTKRLHGMVNSTLMELREVAAKQKVAVLMRANNVPKHLWPKPKPEEIAYRTVEEVTGALANMATAGVPIMPGDPAVDAVRDMVGLPRTDPRLAEMQLLESALATMRLGEPQEAAGGREGKPDDGGGKPASGGQRPAAGRAGGAKPRDLGSSLSASMESLRTYLEAGA